MRNLVDWSIFPLISYEESRSSAAHVKKKILTAKLLPSEQSECAEDNANEEETLQEESNPQAKQSDEKLRESLNNLLSEFSFLGYKRTYLLIIFLMF